MPVRAAPRAHWRFPLAFGLASALHGGALLGALTLAPRMLGNDGARIGAIDVSIVTGEAFDSAIATHEVESAAGGTVLGAPIAPPVANQPTSTDASEALETNDARLADPQPPMPQVEPVAQVERDDVKRASDADAAPPVADSQDQSIQLAGDATTLSVTVAVPHDTATAAPTGLVDAYKSAVAAALSKTKPPSGRGRRGTARIVFTIGLSGSVQMAAITASSGDAPQDDMALSAVRSTRFPVPDPLLTQAQRTFPIEYSFRAALR